MNSQTIFFSSTSNSFLVDKSISNGKFVLKFRFLCAFGVDAVSFFWMRGVAAPGSPTLSGPCEGKGTEQTDDS